MGGVRRVLELWVGARERFFVQALYSRSGITF